MSGAPQANQAAYWNEEAGPRWVAAQERMDTLFAPLTEAALDHAAPQPGERVLDIGCGCGATVLALAASVRATGSVLGVDISRPMLARAAERMAALGLGQARLLLADAATHDFAPGSADLVFSRFGVMFFEDPVAAFANLRGALAPGGRVVFVCWQKLADNPWFLVPLSAARAHLPSQPPADPDAPGPFAFADPERVRRILGSAGFSVVRIEPHETAMRLGGADELEQEADRAIEIGPVIRLLADADQRVRGAVRTAIRDALAAYVQPEGITLSGRVWFVAANA